MLGWVLQRGLQTATGAAEPFPDDTQIEQPDTPGPTFAARALKHAIFGTPAPADRQPPRETRNAANGKPSNATNIDAKALKSPVKPPGILLTPGTGTTRRKRVSFGHDVPVNGDKKDTLGAAPAVKKINKVPNFWPSEEKASRPRTGLTDALEKSRKIKAKESKMASRPDSTSEEQQAEDAWEEVEDLDRDPDITVDLNEPHSRSGKYWKGEFESYHSDAMVQMEKLVKHRHLAKSYAKMKDAEATELTQMLKEEKQKVTKMESRVAELTGQIALKKMSGAEQDHEEMMSTLAKQTALAVQYRDQVQELEALLREDQPESSADGQKRRGRIASPRTHKTLLDTQRELKRAREQVKELNDLRKEVQHIESDLRAAERRELKLELENKRLAGDLSKSEAKAQDLQSRLERSQDDTRRKDEELARLKKEYGTIKDNAKARIGEAQEVFQEKDKKISTLEEEIRALRPSESRISRDSARFIDLTETGDKWSSNLRQLEGKLKSKDEERSQNKERTRPSLQSRTREVNKALNALSAPRSQLDDECHPLSDFTLPEEKLLHRVDSADDDSLASSTFKEEPLPVVTRTASYGSLRHGKRDSAGVLKDRANRDLARDDNKAASRISSVTTSKGSQRSSLADIGSHDRRINSSSDMRSRSAPDDRQKTSLDAPSRLRSHNRRLQTSGSEDPQFDLAQGKFASLSGPEINGSAVWSMNASRSTLPPERRAAALARLQQKRADRKKTHNGYNKENLRP